ncbi:MAG: ADP-ribosylglycohydrolase family protein [Clostridia bacterium]
MDIIKYNKRLVDEADVKIVNEKEEDWTQSDSVILNDNHIKTLWFSRAPGSGAPASVLAGAIQGVKNLGYKVSEAEKIFFNYKDSKDVSLLAENLSYIFYLLNNAEKDESSKYWNYAIYDSFEKYLGALPKDLPEGEPPNDLEERIFYGWVGQIAAGSLGTALEGYGREKINQKFEVIDDYLKPISTYNDDLTFQIALMSAIEESGKTVNSIDIAKKWVKLIPFAWSAEDIALKNLRLGIYPPESGFRSNPYKEWIGAQMRGSICGMLYPAKPLKAAKLAFLDGQISHFNNGVLGEVFNAVMTSIAFYAKDVDQIIKQSFQYIPKDSLYYEVITKSYRITKESSNYMQALEKLEEEFYQYNLVHAFPNIAIEIASMIYGKGDYSKTLDLLVRAGLDVDCNAAQVGNILGVLNANVEKRWVEPLNKSFKTYLRKYKEISLREVSDWTVRLIKKLR